MRDRQWHILNAEPLGYCDGARAILNQLGEVVEGPLDRRELLAQLPKYDVLIVRLAYQVDREMIGAGCCLKAIVTATTGLDHIDEEYAQARGIAVFSLRGETQFLRTISATAEHTWALLLALLRRIPQAAASVQMGDWDRDSFRGNELNGKRLGMIGLGRIGLKVARYGLAFGMDVAAHDPYTTEWMEGVSRTNLDELLLQSDVLSLHVPLNKQTRGMIGAEELALLPQGAVLINTSRGELVDDVALVQALERGNLACAGLDVVPYERCSKQRNSHPLMAYAKTHDNLLITPHIGGATHESMAKTEVFMALKLASFLNNLDSGRTRL